jgi:HEPN domain-containing protein
LANEKIIKKWFSFAVRDLKIAKSLFDLHSDYKNAVGFHLQQCAEKAIKGFLISEGTRPPKTHDVKELSQLVKAKDKKIVSLLKKSSALTKFAVIYRYPDAQKRPIHKDTLKKHIATTEKLYLSLHRLALENSAQA